MAYIPDSKISTYCGSGNGMAVPCVATGLAFRIPQQPFLSTEAGGGGMGNYMGGSPFGTRCGCGGSSAGMGCGMGCAGMAGMFDGSGLLGSGIFASSDVSTWGVGEVAVILAGLFVVYSVFSTTSRGVSKVSRKVKYAAGAPQRARQERARKMRAEARMLEGDSGGKKKSGGFF